MKWRMFKIKCITTALKLVAFSLKYGTCEITVGGFLWRLKTSWKLNFTFPEALDYLLNGKYN